MRNLPFWGSDACYTAVLEHDGDLDEEDCEEKEGIIDVCELRGVVVLVSN